MMLTKKPLCKKFKPPGQLHLLAAQALVEEADGLLGSEEGMLDPGHLQHLLHHPLPLLLLPDPIGQGSGDPGGHHHQADHHDRHDHHHHHQAPPGGHHHQADPRRL